MDSTEKATLSLQRIEIRFHIFKMLLMILIAVVSVLVLYTAQTRSIDQQIAQQQKTRAYITCIITINPQAGNPQAAVKACTQKYGN
jgi:hypothetical protein